MDVYSDLMARTEPGPGAAMADSGISPDSHLKMRSIPNVDTDRLLRTRLWLHAQLHTVEGLRSHDGGLRIKAISHELALRGFNATNGCEFCDAGDDSLPDRKRSTW